MQISHTLSIINHKSSHQQEITILKIRQWQNLITQIGQKMFKNSWEFIHLVKTLMQRVTYCQIKDWIILLKNY